MYILLSHRRKHPREEKVRVTQQESCSNADALIPENVKVYSP